MHAWLLAVANLDPASFRAFDYVRLYGVLNKIVEAKLKGTFDEMTRPARHSARFRELQEQGRASDLARNSLGLGECADSKPEPLRTTSIKSKARPKEVIRAERRATAERVELNAQLRGSPLNRMPRALPALPAMLANALGVGVRAARKWIAEGDAPKTVLHSLFWLTRWGMSEADCLARNDAIAKASEAAALRSEVERLRSQLQLVGRIGQFGSANDPLSSGMPARRNPAPETPASRRPRAVPLVFTSIRRAPCAAAGRKNRSA